MAGTVLELIQEAPAPGAAAGFDTVLLSPDGAYAYVSEPDVDGVAVYTRDPATGLLAPLEEQLDGVAGVEGMDSPEAMALSPDGRHLYVVSRLAERLVRFDRDALTGRLTFAAADAAPRWPARVAVSPDGRNVLVGTYDEDDFDPVAMAMFVRDTATGALTRPFSSNRVYGVSMVPSADGTRWYIGGSGGPRFRGADVAIWGRDPQSGSIVFPGPLDVVNRGGGLSFAPTMDVALPPGEGQVFAALPSSLVVLDLTPDLAPRQWFRSYERDSQGIPGLRDVRDVAVSPDGAHVYVAAWEAGLTPIFGSLISFRRDAQGNLRSTESVLARSTGILAGANSIAVSQDSRFVYAAARMSQTIIVLEERSVCPPAPRIDCRAAERATVAIQAAVDGRQPKLRFRWTNDTSSFLFNGDPLGGTTYSLCVFEDQAGTPALVASLDAPQGKYDMRRGWKRFGSGADPSRYLYTDAFLAPDGVRTASLSHHRLILKAQGPNAPLPALPVRAPFTVQIVGNSPDCWTSSFAAADVRPFDPARGTFKATSRVP